MGATPAKYFPLPTPYGSTPDIGALSQAKAAAPAPPTNFLPLNPPDPSQQPQQQAQPATTGFQNQLNPFGLRNMYSYGGGAQMMRNLT